MTDLTALFDQNKVPFALAQILPIGEVRTIHLDRYSLLAADGIVTQVLTTTSLHASDPDVIAYLAVDPADAWIWDPAHPERLQAAVESVAAQRGIRQWGAVWVFGNDVHPNNRSKKVVAALVLLGRTLFVRATASAVKRTIYRPDGANENTYTVLGAQVIRHYDPELVRFDADITRAARDDLSSDMVCDTCIGRGTKVQFGDSMPLDPQDPMQRMMLRQQLGYGSADDAMRRHRLSGKKVAKLLKGGAPIAEALLPFGYVHARDATGTPIHVDGRGKVPVADWTLVPVVQALVRAHAAGESYADLGTLLANRGVARRGQRAKGAQTLQELLAIGDRTGLGWAAKSLLVNKNASVVGGVESYLSRIHLWRTGEFVIRIRNEIRGRGIKVAGVTPTYVDGTDEYGHFDIRVQWPWPIDPATGEELVAWGVAEELRQCEERLRQEFGRRSVTGGAAHAVPLRRALSPDEWTVGDELFSVQSRQRPGRRSCVLMSNSVAARAGRPGWTVERNCPEPYSRATFHLDTFCASVAEALHGAVSDLLSEDDVALAALQFDEGAESGLATPTPVDNDPGSLLEVLRVELAELSADAEGQELLAGRRLVQGDEEGAARAEQRAGGLRAEIADRRERMAELERSARAVGTQTSQPRSVVLETRLNAIAYIIAGLRRAAQADGLGPSRLADLTGRHLSEWRLRVDGAFVYWQTTLRLPLSDGRSVSAAIEGRVANVRTRTGGTGPFDVGDAARQVLVDDVDPTTVAKESARRMSRRQVIVMHLLPWLQKQAVPTSGARLALLDHPVVGARQVMYTHITGDETPANEAWSPTLRDHLVHTYKAPTLQWGNAAVPDFTVPLQRIVTAAGLAGSDGISVSDLAAATGLERRAIRELAQPYDRSGFMRPIYLAFHADDGDRLVTFDCPHCGAGPAARVLLLPEVYASGYGVVCDCGRVPTIGRAPNGTRWEDIVFPAAYTHQLPTRINRSSLRAERQSGLVDRPPRLALA